MKTLSLLATPMTLLLGASLATAQCPPKSAGQIDLHNYGAAAVYFGRSVDISSDYLAVGAPGYDPLTGGLAYLFEEDSGGWSTIGQLTPSTGEAGDDFGRSISVQGSAVLVGAPHHGNVEGRAYLFEAVNGNWTETMIFDPPSFHEEFGHVVLLASPFAFVAAPETEEVFVYEQIGSTWTGKQTLTPPGEAGDFGTSLAVSGSRLLIGAPDDDSVLIYELLGGQWVWTSTITETPGTPSEFGEAVALEGDTAFVGAPEWNSEVGRVHEYEFDGTNWNMVAILLPDSSEAAEFGSALALAGNSLLVGAPAEDDLAGATYLFESFAGPWVKNSKIMPQLGTTDYNFGTALAIDPVSKTYFVNVGLEEVVIFGAANGYAGSIYLWSDDVCPVLYGDQASISLASGGAQTLTLTSQPSSAGMIYLVLGTVSGTSPGMALNGLTLPLNIDSYTVLTLASPNTPPLGTTLGVLDASGGGTATVAFPAGISASLAGLQLDHAALVLDSATGVVAGVTNSVPLSLLP